MLISERCLGRGGRQNNKELASEIYSRLPRELRNRIYSYCVQGPYDNEVIVRRSSREKDTCTFLIRHTSGQHSYQWIRDPIASIISIQNLGVEIAKEMLESYYWTRTFKFSHHESLLLVPFLLTDSFGLDMVPADYARRIHLSVQPFECPRARMSHIRETELKQCLAAVEALSRIRTPRTEVIINMDLSESFAIDIDHQRSPDDNYEILPKIEQVVDSLTKQGLRAGITYSRAWNE